MSTQRANQDKSPTLDWVIDSDTHISEPPDLFLSRLPEKWQDYIELNARLAKEWPTIEESKDPLDSAEEFKEVEDKKSLIDESAGG